MNPTDILNALDSTEPGYRHEAIDTAVAQQDAMTPALLALLDNLLADPYAYAKVHGNAHLYAIPLLGHFAETSAHDRFLALARLPEEVLEELLGDAVTETLPIVLWRTHDTSFEGIKSLLADKQAFAFSRISAAKVLVYAVTQGLLPREEVLGALADQFSDDETEDLLNGGLVNAMLDLWPRGYEERITHLIENDLLDPWSVVDEDLDEALELGLDSCLEQTREKFENRIPTNIHDYLSHWACFNECEDEEDFNPAIDSEFSRYLADHYGFPGESPRKAPSQAEKEKRKKQRKAASKARQKNKKKKTKK